MKKGARRRMNAKKNKKQRAKLRKNPAVSLSPRMTQSLTIDLALAMLRVFDKHGLIGPFPKPANDKDLVPPYYAGGKLQ